MGIVIKSVGVPPSFWSLAYPSRFASPAVLISPSKSRRALLGGENTIGPDGDCNSGGLGGFSGRDGLRSICGGVADGSVLKYLHLYKHTKSQK